MKKINRLATLLFIVLVATPVTSAAENRSRNTKSLRPSCITCGWQGDCRSCTTGGQALFCRTPDCATCDESGECGLLDSPASIESADSPAITVKTFRLGSQVIREVSAKHPRFGATLANLNMFGFSSGVHRIHWTPVPISSEDIDAFLDRSTHHTFFKKYNERACQINRLIQKGEISEILYVVTISQQDSHTWTIKLQLAGTAPTATTSDPSYSSLEVIVVFEGLDIARERPIKTTWHVN